ncbi:MAG: hypothetical protein ACE5G0_12340 [Rhodothermales bacterium]
MQAYGLFPKPLFLFFVVLCVLGAVPSAAQETETRQEDVLLRLAHGGVFLPEGTALVVLADTVAPAPDAIIQPRFLAPGTYPLNAASVLRQDTLGVGGRTRARYAKTQSSGMRYFVYARTQQGTVYWSYSALKDSAKYDTVAKGVMAVAPIAGAAVREQVIQTFFDGPLRFAATTAPAVETTEAEVAPSVSLPTAPQEETHSETMIPVSEASGILFSTGFFIVVVGVVLALIVGLFLLMLHFRSRLVQALENVAGAPVPFNSADWHPDRRSGLEKNLATMEGELAEVKDKHERLQKTYNVLLARHKALIREVQRLQQHNGHQQSDTPTSRPLDPPKVGP